MSAPSPDLARIARLRDLFLGERPDHAALRDYWRDRDDLLAYDAVLGARIGWKWDAALEECAERGFARADTRVVLDFGCGAGVAARRFTRRFGAGEVLCHDRSQHAMAFAVERLSAELPGVPARSLPRVPDDFVPDVLLVSHVLGELDDRGEAALRALLARARTIVLVEPGSKAVARRLSALRDQLLAADATWRIVAPCPHRGACPTLARDTDWCHFFAPPPPEVFTDGNWVRTARAVGIDLRALPYAFVALARDVDLPAPPANRALGRADVGPHDARVTLCTAQGLEPVVITKRHDAATWRRLKKAPEDVRTWTRS